MTMRRRTEGEAPTPATARRSAALVLGVAFAALVCVYATRMTVGPAGYRTWWEGVVQVSSYAVASALCLLRAFSTPVARRAWLLLSAGVLLYSAGWACSVVSTEIEGHRPSPSVCDALWLSFYPCAIVALFLLVRSRGGRFSATYWLDGIIGAAGVAAIGTGLVLPRLDIGASASWIRVVLNSIYPASDLLLLLVTVTVLVAARLQVPTSWWLFTAGAGLFVVTDVVSLTEVAAHGEYTSGTWLNVGWLVAIGLFALAPGQHEHPGRRSRASWPALAPPILGALVALLVLVRPPSGAARPLAVTAATVAILLTLLRLALSFVEERSLAETRAQAVTDDLTGLRNRRGFYREARAMLREASSATLVLIDLDGFKEVNDTLGHAAGDRLIIEVGARLGSAARNAPRGGRADVLARLGGDEFTMLLPDVAVQEGQNAADRLLATLESPFEIDGVPLHVRASAGLVSSPEDGRQVEELLRKADIAMYSAKARRTGSQVYRPELDTRTRAALALQEQLRTAVRGDALVLHFQPKIDLRSGRVVAVEALARIDDPRRGLLYPAVFLPTLEQAAIMPLFSERVLDLAVGQAAEWRRNGLELPVAVNLRADAFADPRLSVLVEGVLARHGLPGSLLVVEVTEDTLMGDRPAGRDAIEQLRILGVHVAIDDYGTGYSSLAYLRDLPVDELKLDRAFISDMAADARAAQIVHSTIDLAHSLGMRMVAEGVETAEVAEELRRYGCDQAQGYYFARPMLAAELVWKLAAGGRLLPTVDTAARPAQQP